MFYAATILFFWSNTLSTALIFSRTKVCSESGKHKIPTEVCKDLFTGSLKIKNEEKYYLKLKNNKLLNRTAREHDAGNTGLVIEIEKTKVSFVYDLQYKMDVFHHFEEEVYQYTWNEVGNNPIDFCYKIDAKKCAETGIRAQTPDNKLLPWANGRCCWCPNALLFESDTSHYQRSSFNCNFADLLFRNGIWTSKSCPRVFGPWYSAYEVKEWRWYFMVRVTLTWWNAGAAGKNNVDNNSCKSASINIGKPLDEIDCDRVRHQRMAQVRREYNLTISRPEFYDEELDVKFRITFQQPQTEANPQDLDSYVLFIPSDVNGSSDRSNVTKCKYKTEGPTGTKKCLPNALLIDKTHVDFTGYSCNKIGTSLRYWGALHGQFCHRPPGSCMGNQIGSFIESDKRKILKGGQPEYQLKTRFGGDPVHYSDLPFIGGGDLEKSKHYLGWNYEKEHITEIDFEMDADEIIWLRTDSPGHITFIEGPFAGTCSSGNDDGCLVRVFVLNSGSITSRFSVELPFCFENGIPVRDFDPVPPVGKSIDSNSTKVFPLVLRLRNPDSNSYSCKAELYDNRHALLDYNIFNFTTSKLMRKYQGQQIPPAEAKVKVVAPEVVFFSRVRRYYSYLLQFVQSKSTHSALNKLFGTTRGSSQCSDCGYNPFCYIINISTCVQSITDIIWTITSFFMVLILIVLAVPLFRVLIILVTKFVRWPVRDKPDTATKNTKSISLVLPEKVKEPSEPYVRGKTRMRTTKLKGLRSIMRNKL